MAESITRETLLREAGRQKLDASADKLDRWVRRGLIPRPTTTNLGGRTGRQSLYPAEAVEQIAAVCDALSIDRRLDRAALLVWWWGFDVSRSEVRQVLSKEAAELDQEISELRTAQEDGTIDQLIEESGQARVRNKVMGRARRHVGRDAFPTIVRILLEVATGSFSGLYSDYATGEDEGLLLERALGMARARTDQLPDGSDPWLTGQPEDSLSDLSSIMGGTLSDVLDTTSDFELDLAREEIAPIFELLPAVTPALEAEKGEGAYGMTDFGRVLGGMKPDDLARFFLMWLILRTFPELRPGIEEMGRAAREALLTLGHEEVANTTAF